MRTMFNSAGSFKGNSSSWNVSRCTSLRGVFYNTVFESDLSVWDAGAVASTEGMFQFSRAFNSNIPRWDVSSSQNANGKFLKAEQFKQNLCLWGPRLNMSALVPDVFRASGCPNTSDPGLASVPQGPLRK